jgi:outer membrane immunogenic protein
MGALMKKKGFLLATSAGFALAPLAAHAADMSAPILKARPLPPPAPTWAGFYVGGNVGTAWQQTQNTLNGGAPYSASFGNCVAPTACTALVPSTSSPTSFFLPFSNTPTTSHTGLIGGGQIGYNWQYAEYVFGIEGDFQGLTGSGTSSVNGIVGDVGRYSAHIDNSTTTISNRIRWLSTIRTRSGLAFGNTLAYVTGGLAIGGVRNNVTFNTVPLAAPPCYPCGGFAPYSAALSQSKTRIGWTVGFGVEHMWDQHWTIGAEGLFVDLGNNNSTFSSRSFPFSGASLSKSTPLSLKTTTQAVIGRLKVNYKF